MLRVADPQSERNTPSILAETFKELLKDADREGFMKLLGLGRFPPGSRRRMEPVFSALCCGLWKIAMRSAVPDQCEKAYSMYVNSLWFSMEDADSYVVLLRDLEDYLPFQGCEDFTPAAREILIRAGHEQDQASLMGLALFIRRLYEYFFNHII